MICRLCKKERNDQEFVKKNGRPRKTCQTCLDKYIQKCKKVGCKTSPIYNIPGETKGLYCVLHKKKNMINVKDKKCKVLNCKTRPIYNIPGETIGLYCKKHKKKDMINVKDKKCKKPKCGKIPDYNYPEEFTGIYCVTHKKDGMIDVKNKKCKQPGCKRTPYYNKAEEKSALYCVLHKTDEMVNVRDRTCAKKGCKTIPFFNKPSETKGLYCVLHKKKNMINVKDKTCAKKGCKSLPLYNKKGEKRPIYCAKHKKKDMVDVKTRKCEDPIGCNIKAYYGIPGNSPTHCTRHKKENMIKNPKRKCCTDNCKNIAMYGIVIASHCENHKEDDEICLVQRVCKQCKRIDILSPNEICLNFCELQKHHEQYKKYVKRKQLRVEKILREEIGPPDLVDTVIDSDCGLERPDFLYECKTHNVFIEPDERQHKDRCAMGEVNRMKNLFFSMGQDCPSIFIRYNPDNFRVDNVLQKIPQSKREEELIRYVKYYIENIPTDICSVIYLFYDEYQQGNVEVFSFDPYKTDIFSCDSCDRVFYIESMYEAHTH